MNGDKVALVTKRIAWNKGLTKETDSRVAKYASSIKNHIKTPEHCRHISESKRGKPNPKIAQILKGLMKGVNNPFYGKHHTGALKQRFSNERKGIPSKRKGIKQPSTTGELNPAKRPEVRTLISLRVKETHWDSSLENNPNWAGGKSFLPYAPYRHLRPKIEHLDNQVCVLCGNKETLSIHHIDYVKLNNHHNNLCILCRRCNSRVNKGREFWMHFLTKLVLQRRKVGIIK